MATSCRNWVQLTSLILIISPLLIGLSFAQPNCGTGGPCAAGSCCSKYGYCGTTSAYCGADCVSQCPSSPPSDSSGVGNIVTSSLYNSIFPNRNSFYTYNSFISATAKFPSFGTTGSSTQQKQDIAALFAQVSHETSGLNYINEIDQSPYCDSTNNQYPCVSGQEYYGRGPLQISWNYNYGPCGQAIGQNLLSNPGLVATNPVVSWETALWFWTTAQSPKPSSEAVMDGRWTPSSSDIAAGRKPGFGVTIDIINGGLECGPNAPDPSEAADRVTLYRKICSMLGVVTGNNVVCSGMQPY